MMRPAPANQRTPRMVSKRLARRHFQLRTLFASLALAAVCGLASACNIPVFRYALERWKSDTYEVTIFHDDDFDRAESEETKLLQAQAEQLGNISLSFVDLNSMSAQQAATWKRLGPESAKDSWPAKPYAILQTELKQKDLSVWRGNLEDFTEAKLIHSPARKQIASRLLAGDSVVWLVVKSQDEEANAAVHETLNNAFEHLESRIKIPEGVGLPGSELFSEIPLLVQFSTVEVAHDDEHEVFLRNLSSQLQPDAHAAKEPLVIPVFGRGRALEVIPGSQLNATTVEELTLFLSGPCSCQVKDQNPGFDLLFSVDWDRELFDEDSERPPVRAVSDPQSSPRLLTIPPGSKRR